MNVIGHQAPNPDFNMMLLAPMRHQINVRKVVFVAKKGLLTTIAPLGDVMGISRSCDPGDSSHK
jgi:hypothetical protein